LCEKEALHHRLCARSDRGGGSGGLNHACPVQVSIFGALTRNYLLTWSAPPGRATTETKKRMRLTQALRPLCPPLPGYGMNRAATLPTRPQPSAMRAAGTKAIPPASATVPPTAAPALETKSFGMSPMKLFAAVGRSTAVTMVLMSNLRWSRASKAGLRKV
jgi:hypothetical protein